MITAERAVVDDVVEMRKLWTDEGKGRENGKRNGRE